jgi:hypothetical protein
VEALLTTWPSLAAWVRVFVGWALPTGSKSPSGGRSTPAETLHLHSKKCGSNEVVWSHGQEKSLRVVSALWSVQTQRWAEPTLLDLLP